MRIYKYLFRPRRISLGLIIPIGIFLFFALNAVNAATLSLSPPELSVSAGDAFDVNILLDTTGAATDGVDIHYLNFDPALLEVQQVQPGTLYPSTQSNTFDNAAGTINFSQVTAGGNTYTGSGTLATITFKALAEGAAAVTFDFTSGNTTDTNVASSESDILSSVSNGSYTLTAVVSDTAPPTLSSGSPSGALAAGTTQTTMSVATDEGATCKYSSSAGTTYASMPSTFSTTGSTSHSTTITGLSDGNSYNYYIRCQDASSNANTSDYAVSFSVSAPANNNPIGNVDGADEIRVTGWAYDADAGTNPINVHIYIDGTPTANITANLPRQDLVDAGITSDPNHGFDYTLPSLSPGDHTINVYAINTPTGNNPELPGSPKVITVPQPTSDTVTSLKTLSSMSIDGNFSETVWSQANSITFSNATLSDNTVKVYTLYDDSNLYFAYDVTDANLEATDTSLWQDDGAEIYLDANHDATTSMNVDDYHFIMNINDVTSGGAITTKTLTRQGGYIMEIQIPWSTVGVSPIAGKIIGILIGNNDRDNGSSSQFDWMNIIAAGSYAQPDLWGDLVLSSQTVGSISDTAPPTLSSGSPSGALAAGTTQTTMSVTTNENATCKYGTAPQTTYASMPSTFSTTGSTSHSTTITGLSDGNSYNYYIRCQDASSNANTSDYAVSFSVSAPVNNDPIGNFDGADTVHVTGWAYDKNAGTNPIDVHIYIDGTHVGTQTANITRSGLGRQIYNGMTIQGDNHGFDWSLPSLSVGNHTINVYAINTPTGANPELDGSPKVVTATDTQAPIIPTNLQATVVSSSQIDLLWNPSTDNVGVTGYKIYRNLSLITTIIGTSYSNTGLNPSTQYSYTVSAIDVAGNESSQSISVNATTLSAPDTTPPVISNGSPTGSLNSGTTQTTISVTTDEQATCKYGTTPQTTYSLLPSTFTTTGSTSHSTTITGLSDGNSYNYYIRCQDASSNANTSDYAVSFSVSAPADTAPPVISDIQATNITTDSVTVAFITDEPAVSYVEYGLTTGYGNTTQENSTLNSNFQIVISGLSDNTTYNYRVVSRDGLGNSSQSVNKTFTTETAVISDTVPPSEITTLAISNPSSTSLDLNWVSPGDDGDVGTAYSYEIRMSTAPFSGNASVWWNNAIILPASPSPKTSGSQEMYTVVGLVSDTAYYFAVMPQDEAGNRPTITSSGIKQGATLQAPDTVAPNISNIQAASISANSATITWNTNELAASQIEYGITNNYGNLTVVNSSLKTSHSEVINNLTPDTLYHYRVKSKDAAGNESISSDYTFQTQPLPDTAPPSAVSDLSYSDINHSSVKISWTSPGDDNDQGTAALYDIRYSSSNSALINWTQASQVAGEPSPKQAGTRQSVTVSNLSPGTFYYFAVKSSDESSNISPISNIINFTTRAQLPPVDETSPIISNAQTTGITHNSATIIWQTNEAADSEVYYGTDSSDLSFVSALTDLTANHSIEIAGLDRKTVYYYQIKSKDSSNNQSVSNTKSFTTSSRLPKPPKVENLQINQNSRTLSWNNPDYEFLNKVVVFRRLDKFPEDPLTEGQFIKETIRDNQIVSFQDTDTGYNITYYYSVFTADDLGIYSDPSQISFTTGLKDIVISTEDLIPPSGPSNFEAMPADRQITLSWSNPEDDDFVRVVLLRKLGSASGSVDDGEIIFEGNAENFTDINLDNNITYYYTIFAYDNRPNYSKALSIAARPLAGQTTISLPPAAPAPASAPAPSPAPSPAPAPLAPKEKAFVMPQGIIEGDLVRGPDGIKVYIVNQFGYMRHIFNPKVFEMYSHFRWDTIHDLDEQTFNAFTVSDLYRAESDTRVFSLKEIDEARGSAQKQWMDVTSEQFSELNFSWNQVFIINDIERDYYGEGTPLTYSLLRPRKYYSRLVKTSDSSTVYYVNRFGIKKPILNETVFFSYNNKWEDILTITNEELNSLDSYDGIIYNKEVYIIDDNNVKHHVQDIETFNNLGLDWDKIVSINQTEFEEFRNK